MTEKTVALSMRVTPSFKRLLDEAAALERRSRTNLLEMLLLAHCRERGIQIPQIPNKKRQEASALSSN